MEEGKGRSESDPNRRVNGTSFSINDPENQRAKKLWTVDNVKAMRFKSLSAAKSFYRLYAAATGFKVEKQGSVWGENDMVVMRRWVCNRGGFCKKKKNLEKAKNSIRADCPAAFCVSLGYASRRWLVREFVAEHTHELGFKLCPQIYQPIEVEDYLTSVEDSSTSYRSNITIDDAEAAISYLTEKKDSEPRLFYEVNYVNASLARIFFADSMAQLDCSCFGDVVAVYRTNSSDLHFVILFSLNHHHQTTILGCAILSDETVEAYTWMFQKFLDLMQGCMPLSIVTDGNKALGEAIKSVLPESRHRLCTWHLEKIASSIVDNPSFLADFKVLMLDFLSLNDFELKWKAMVENYKLSENPWILEMYRKRHEWAETYLRGHFWARLRSTKVCQVLDGNLSRLSLHKLKLNQVLSLYDSVVMKIRINEGKADYDSKYSKFTPSTPLVKMEKQAFDIFTRESYQRFLSEMQMEMFLVALEIDYDDSPCRKYILAKIDHEDLVYEVMFNPCGLTIECSCLKFETLGFPCSHIFHVLKSEGFKDVPHNLMHQRWTKSAKSTTQFWRNYLPPVSVDVVARMMSYGRVVCSSSPMLYLGTQSEEAFKIVSSCFVKLKGELDRQDNSVLDVQDNKDTSSSSDWKIEQSGLWDYINYPYFEYVRVIDMIFFLFSFLFLSHISDL
ncbi:hypothetical protein HN51_020531 [Arachis hypogaea]|uniref:Protein FAR1-RELATED SEQUENCE n=1 Tax=Arachis hypogaea TaxID=3818 RepID=A0A445C1A6_ARAHY|nr:hypothetical protein Ahy_A08g040989 [Arachis hypogaea]